MVILNHITTAILESTMHSGIIKTNIFELLPVLTILENCCNNNETNEKTKITKRDFNHENTKTFQFLSEHIKWDRFLSSNTPNKAYNKFWKMSLTYSILLSQKGN